MLRRLTVTSSSSLQWGSSTIAGEGVQQEAKAAFMEALQRGPPHDSGGKARGSRRRRRPRPGFNGVPPRQRGGRLRRVNSRPPSASVLQRGPPTTAGGRTPEEWAATNPTQAKLQRGPPDSRGKAGWLDDDSYAAFLASTGSPHDSRGKAARPLPWCAPRGRFNGVPPRQQGEGSGGVPTSGSPSPLQRGPPTTAGGRR